MRKSNSRPKRKPWELNTLDYFHEKVYAQKRTMRYELFFNFLRISPSYLLALESASEAELTIKLGDQERAAQVWKTREDVGDVYRVMFKEWWLTRGINLFGIHTRRPKVEGISYLQGGRSNDSLIASAQRRAADFITTRFDEQGRPDSILVSIPLGQTRIKTSRELYELMNKVEESYPVTHPVPMYQLEKNRIQDRRLRLGIDLVFFRSAFPNWELWRVGARARISKKHKDLDPLTQKKGVHNEEARRGLTLIASRMYKESITIAENAAIGKFPCLESIKAAEVDIKKMGRILSDVNSWEKDERRRMQEEQARD